MNVVAERPPSRQDGQSHARCAQCGSPLAEDQEWCLECGAARTLIHRPPDWRIGAAIVGTVVALVLAGFAIALINLSSEANRSAASASPTAARAATAAPAAAAKTTTTSARRISAWPVGLPGWTVVLFSSTSRQSAQATATRLSGGSLHVGVLSTSQHPSTNMNPGHWIVFTGRYPTRNAATAHATALDAKGYRARARRVGLPGR